jgi:hypothetical protein
MLTTVFSRSAWLPLIRSTPASPFLDDFITTLMKAGYRPGTLREHLRAAAHLSRWLEHHGQLLTDLDGSDAERFKRHIARCQCAGFKRRAKADGRGADLFLQHLRHLGVVTKRTVQASRQPPLLLGVCQWMRQHRGAREATLKGYGRIILDALRSLGDDPTQFDARGLRAFVLGRAPRYGRSKAKLVVSALRTFECYLTAQGLCPVGLDAAIPTIAGWKLAALPWYLPTADVERVVASCDPATAIGARDRAVLLLLSQLGLRAGDVSNLRWRDIDWHHSTIEVMGKSPRAVRLPLSQEVGDALLHHLANAHGTSAANRLCGHKPLSIGLLWHRPPLSPVTVSTSSASLHVTQGSRTRATKCRP